MPNAVNVQQDLLRLVGTPSAETPLPGLATVTTASQTDAAPNNAVTDLSQELESLRRQLGAAEETTRRQADILEQNTRAVLESTAGSSVSGIASVARDAVSSVGNSSGLGLLSSPLVGLAGWLLGRRGGAEEEPVLPAFSLPAPIDGNLGLSSSGGLPPVTYGGDGLPRTVPQAPAAAPANITIQVQTMDSRSFVDNSDQIARAVREAMLNSHAINDVIGEM